MVPVTKTMTKEACNQRHKYVWGALVLLFSVSSIFVVLVGLALSSGMAATAAAAKVEQVFAVHQAEQKGAADRVSDSLLRIELGIKEGKDERKAQRAMIEQIIREIHSRPVVVPPGGGG